MENKQQTAVDLFFDELEKKGNAWENASIRAIQISIDVTEYLNLKRQAKERFRQQIKDAWTDGNCNTDLKGNPSANYAISAEHYYNQKYGSNNEQQ